MMPPRHGKSSLVSHFFPAWFLGLFPDKRVLLCSYEADFAASWGRKARDLIDEHGEQMFGVRVRQETSAAARWELEGHAGSMVTAGVGGAIVGRGADVLIIDDPIKNCEAAHSKTIRDAVWEWFKSTAYTRLEPNGAIIVVMTRWHSDDLAGRILTDMTNDGETWRVLRFPAICETDNDELGRRLGEPLWSARFNRERLEQVKRTVGSYLWAALYQQTPVTREGGMFRREWFEVVDVAPSEGRQIRFWDFAATEPKHSSDPDWTVGALVGLSKTNTYFIKDIRRIRGTPQAVERLVLNTAQNDGVGVRIVAEQEGGASGVTVTDHYRRNVLNGFSFTAQKPTTSKEIRAMPFSSQAEGGNVKLVKGSWNRDFLDEIELFPHGSHDDQVDAVSGAMALLTRRGEMTIL
jgi:predicted phage terminase large subunit-like protein